MSSPLISVIIPVYNTEAYITQCLDSVLQQTHTNLEIICVDDCGQDNSIEMINTIAKNDDRVKVIHHTKNAGTAAARNTGMKAANGEYIFFLDPDDYLDIHIIEKMVDNAIYTNADVVTSQTVSFADDPNDITQTLVAKNLTEYYGGFQGINCRASLDNFTEINRAVSAICCGKLFKMQFITDNKLRFIDDMCSIAEDQGFYIKWLSCFPLISSIDAVGIFYRIRNNSAMHFVRTASKGDKTSITNAQISVFDAIAYIRDTKSPKIAKALIAEVKKMNVYDRYIARQKPFYFRWTKHEKYIKLFGIKIFSKRDRKSR